MMGQIGTGSFKGHANSRLLLAVSLVLLAVLLIPAARPFLQPDYQVAHDRTTPFLRVQALQDAVAEGQIPPRWFPDFDGGYGSPYPSFYGMGFYYAAAIFSAIGIPLGSSVELTAFLSLALSGIGMFLLGRYLWGAPGGLLSAGLYVYAPYHLVDAYVRGAYSELAAFVWFPLITLSMLLWQDRQRARWVVTGGMAVAGLVITHNISSMVFLPALPVFGFAILLRTRSGRSGHRVILGWSLMALLGALLSAYFWLPAVMDQGFINPGYFLQFDYRGDFVGFRFLFSTASEHTLTTEIGVPLLLTAAVSTGILFFSRPSQRLRRIVITSGFLAAFYTFMTNYRSDFIWASIQPLAFVQFPWRLLAIVDFFLAVISGGLIWWVKGKWQPWLLALSLPVASILLHQSLIQIPDRVSQEWVNALSACHDVWGTQDYRPAWSQAAYWGGTSPPEASPGSPVLPACENQISVIPSKSVQTLGTFSTGTEWTIMYTAMSEAVMRLPTYYYPPWTVSVDGRPVAARPESGTGLLEFSVPTGTHKVEAVLGRTKAQAAGVFLSSAGLVGIIGFCVFRSTKSWLSSH